jgi:triosephosphate isomerase
MPAFFVVPCLDALGRLNFRYMNKLIVANWKMHKTLAESVAYTQAIADALHKLMNVQVILCPPYPSLALMEGLLQDTRVGLGAQNVAVWTDGTYTGEVSASMLASLCGYVIVGHSERRKLLGETVEIINNKLRRVAEAQLQPIVCVSNEEELTALAEVKDLFTTWIVAFEPIEAIGTGQPSDPKSVEQMTKTIRKMLGKKTIVLYGGSVAEDNIKTYLKVSDGALVGGASLDPQQFLRLCEVVDRG